MGYNFKRYCSDIENVENYQKAKKDNFKGWECHHRLETHNSDGIRRDVDISHKELKALGMYYHRPSSELIFLKISEHTSLHRKGKQRSEETRNKIRASKKGKKLGKDNSFYGKHHSEETRKKISESKKVTRWFNNGKINIRVKECPPGFVPGRLK